MGSSFQVSEHWSAWAWTPLVAVGAQTLGACLDLYHLEFSL